MSEDFNLFSYGQLKQIFINGNLNIKKKLKSNECFFFLNCFSASGIYYLTTGESPLFALGMPKDNKYV